MAMFFKGGAYNKLNSSSPFALHSEKVEVLSDSSGTSLGETGISVPWSKFGGSA